MKKVMARLAPDWARTTDVIAASPCVAE
jgi:hypothetical protein